MRRVSIICGIRYPSAPPPTGPHSHIGIASCSRSAAAKPKQVNNTSDRRRKAVKPLAVRPHGRPARLSFSWSSCVLPACARRVRKLPTPSNAGRTTRSKSGSDSSTSASVAGMRPPSVNCARRASSRSPGLGAMPTVSPYMINSTPRAATIAMPSARRFTSDLDLHDLLDDARADCDGEDSDPQQNVTEGIGEHRTEVRRRDEAQEDGEKDREQRDDDS